MMKSEAEEFLNKWGYMDMCIFKYIQPLMPVEYVMFKKDVNSIAVNDFNDKYVFEKEQSTFKILKDLDRDGMIKALCSGELVFVKFGMYWSDLRSMKTGGCTCGAWILKDHEGLHDEKCDMYKFRRIT